MTGKPGRFAETIFYFLRADLKNICYVVVTGISTEMHVHWEGMHGPCTLHFKGHQEFLDILKKRVKRQSLMK